MPQELTFSDMLLPLIIILVTALAAWIFYWRISVILHRLADKTKTSLDNFLIRSMKWPVFFGIILLGLYFAALSFPVAASVESTVFLVFQIAFVIVISWVIAMVLDSVYRWYKLEISSITKTALDDRLIGILRVITPILAVLGALIFSLKYIGVDITPVMNWLEDCGSRIGLIIVIAIALIFIIDRLLPKIVTGIVTQRGFRQPDDELRKRSDTLSNFFSTTGQILIIAIAVLMILSELEIDISPILASVGIAGIALGFGAQTLVKDYLAGIFVIMENQYRVGDVVKVAGIAGLVEHIDLRRTILRDLDGIQHIISNGEIRIASNFPRRSPAST